jgi:hypothetical protein
VKKTAVAFAVIIFSLAIFLPLTFNVGTANAQTAYTIQNVTHDVQILNSGNIVITDNIQLSGQTSSFQIGFPYLYGQYVLEGIAYDSDGNELPIALAVALQDQSGFYGATVDLTDAAASESFTVAFTFSNDLLTAVSGGFNFDYPAYPSFTQSVSQCSASITLPSGAIMVGIDKPDGVVNASSYQTSNLAAFTYAPATGTFSQTGNPVQLAEVSSLESQVTFSPTGDVSRVDTYSITCDQLSSTFFPFTIPSTATDLVVRDQFGRQLTFNTVNSGTGTTTVNASYVVALGKSQTAVVTLTYNLPKIDAQSEIESTLFAATNYYIHTATVTYILPEGAYFTAPTSSSQGYPLNRGVFQQTLTVTKTGISFIDLNIPAESTIQLKYSYNYLWIAFRPTIWVAAVVLVALIIIALIKRPKAKAAGPAPRAVITRVVKGGALSNSQVQDFVETYQEKNKVTQELRTLEAQAAHGRIPRRRYKVQRRTLETRLEALSRKASELKEVMRSAGGSYADFVRQLDAAEVELNEAEMTLKNIEVQHETGRISLENYRKQLAELEQRKEKAETTIDGLLLRIRGEIR